MQNYSRFKSFLYYDELDHKGPKFGGMPQLGCHRKFLRSRSIFLISLSAAAQDGVAAKVLAAVAAVVAAVACFRRLRAQLAATTREIDELRDKLAQQQAPPAPPAPVAQVK